jgi:hypothetical protein
VLNPLAVKRKMKPKIELPTKNRLAARAAAVTGGGGGSGETVGVCGRLGEPLHPGENGLDLRG